MRTHAYPFSEYLPVQQSPASEHALATYRSPRNHGISGKLHLHALGDSINRGIPELERVILSYTIGNGEQRPERYILYRAGDFIEHRSLFDARAYRNVVGDVAERLGRRVFKRFLQQQPQGTTGGLFKKDYSPEREDGYVVANTEEHILITKRYPNMVLLRKNSADYREVKELDGLFAYRHQGRRHLIVLESKLGHTVVRRQQLRDDLFMPLQDLFPDTTLSYVLFSREKSLFKESCGRVLGDHYAAVYESLSEAGIRSMFFTFNESGDDFLNLEDHLEAQYEEFKRTALAQNHAFVASGRVIACARHILVTGQGGAPLLSLVLDEESELWRRIEPSKAHSRSAPRHSGK